MSKYYIYKMNILDNPLYFGSYIGQRKLGKKEPMKDGYKGSGSDWRKYILSQKIPVEKEILCMCESVEEANEMEDYYINQCKNDGIYLWNKYKGSGNHEHGRLYTEEELKEHRKQWKKQYREANKEKIAKQDKQYREAHKEQRKQYDKQYKEANKEKIAEYMKQYNKQWQKDHEEDLKNYRKQWYEDHREEAQEQRKEYYKNNKDRFSQWAKEYRENNKEKYLQYQKQYHKQHYEANKEQIAEYQKQYKSQLCEYNGKTITLHGLECRFRRMGIEHPILEAKKYIIEKQKEVA